MSEYTLLATLYVHEGLNVFAGPQLYFLLSAKGDDGSTKVDVAEELDPVDYGLLGGLGYQLDFGLSLGAPTTGALTT